MGSRRGGRGEAAGWLGRSGLKRKRIGDGPKEGRWGGLSGGLWVLGAVRSEHQKEGIRLWGFFDQFKEVNS